MTNDCEGEKAENDFISLCAAAAEVSGGVFVRGKDYSFTKNCLMDWYDKIFDIRPEPSAGNGLIPDMTRRIEKGEIPAAVFLSSALVMRNYDARLVESGFSVFYEQTSMAVGKDGFKPPRGGRVGIRRVESSDELDAWISCLELSFARKRNKALYEKLAGVDGIGLWGLYEGDLLVSTILIQKKAETTGLHLVSTHPDFRGRGYGAGITGFAVERAFQEGADTAVLLSSKMGEGVYSGLGFAAHGKVKHLRYGGGAA